MPKSKKLKEQEELVEILKFTPITVKVQIWGYGGESYIGHVDRATYEFFKAKKIDVEQFVSSWDEDDMWKDIPEQHRFVEPGSPYECDHHFHESGATMDSSSHIQIEGPNGEIIWESSLEISELEEAGVDVECATEFISSDLDEGSVIFWGGQGEKGTFFHGDLLLRAPFDPSKLKITYSDGDGWYLCGGVEYNEVDVDGHDGYSTTGKWAEHKFWIVGDEEVYEGVERDDDWDPAEELEKIRVPVLEGEETQAQQAIDKEPERSQWFDKEIKPYHKGEYEVMKDAAWPNSGMIRAEWSGKSWKDREGNKVKILSWRGLTEQA